LADGVPQGAVAQDTDQLTPLLLGSFPTVAEMFGTVVAAAVDAVVGVTETVANGTVMVTAKDLVGSNNEVAVIVTLASLAGGVAGALYVTPKGLGLVRLPMPDGGEMDQDTPWEAISLVTEAEIGSVNPACTLPAGGVAATETAGTVMITELAAEGFATEVAVTVTVRSLARGAGGAL